MGGGGGWRVLLLSDSLPGGAVALASVGRAKNAQPRTCVWCVCDPVCVAKRKEERQPVHVN